MKQPKKLIADLVQSCLLMQMEWEKSIVITQENSWHTTQQCNTWDPVPKKLHGQSLAAEQMFLTHTLTPKEDDPEFKTTSNF